MRHGTAFEVGSSKGANNSQDPGHSYVAVELENAQHVTQLALTRTLSLSLAFSLVKESTAHANSLYQSLSMESIQRHSAITRVPNVLL